MSDKINIPGLTGGGSQTSKILVYVASPPDADQAIILRWEETDTDILSSEIEALGSYCISEYGLDNPPGNGVWVFDGEIRVGWSRGGDPFEPQDYDHNLSWTGKWRVPNDEEMTKWRAFKTVHLTHKLAEEKDNDGDH